MIAADSEPDSELQVASADATGTGITHHDARVSTIFPLGFQVCELEYHPSQAAASARPAGGLAEPGVAESDSELDICHGHGTYMPVVTMMYRFYIPVKVQTCLYMVQTCLYRFAISCAASELPVQVAASDSELESCQSRATAVIQGHWTTLKS